ncbi:MAG TPA: hypothetical protein VGC18_15440 [Lacisediminihabitans sp.]|uniref:hypothetical protein n=1 Tax=Lacisediminihabitans sp. TaxID=2787631 RepID=UPI002ED7CA67
MEKTQPGVRRRTIVTVGVVVLVLVVAALATTALALHGSSSQTPAQAVTLSTTTVKKTDLTNSQTFSGTLGFGLVQTVKGAGSGTITKLPAAGDSVAQGAALYRVDDVPVPVFFGTTPLFRSLGASGLRGADVAVVADNLAVLGFATGIPTADPAKAVWTARATAALKRWQTAAGLEPTGTLDVGQVLVLPGAVRVNSVTAQLGDPVASDLLTVTATTKVVTVPVKASEIAKVAVGTEVTIVLPDNVTTTGKITAIATVVDSSSGSGGGDSPADGPPTLTVTAVPSIPDDVAALDYASVQVEVTTESHPNVLAVPIAALVALQEGGYALQLPSGTFVAVTTGMFAQSLVEVSGSGITDGLKVVTAQ